MGDAYTTGETFDSVNSVVFACTAIAVCYLRRWPVTPDHPRCSKLQRQSYGDAERYKIYETTVPPGEFVIDDISPPALVANWS